MSGLQSAPCTPVTPTAARPGDRNSALLGSQSGGAVESVVPRRLLVALQAPLLAPPGLQLLLYRFSVGEVFPLRWRAQSRLFSPQLLLQPANVWRAGALSGHGEPSEITC